MLDLLTFTWSLHIRTNMEITSYIKDSRGWNINVIYFNIIHTWCRAKDLALCFSHFLYVFGATSLLMSLLATMKAHDFFRIIDRWSNKVDISLWSTTRLYNVGFPFLIWLGIILLFLPLSLFNSHDKGTCIAVWMRFFHSSFSSLQHIMKLNQCGFSIVQMIS